ncbi:hypothetical protein BD310DRAFT_933130 [Dichomitus squalens]|uniref:Uncharacterized protein n=1 Tax=Dichomitus squalens TaxID=114155 RepID=A0A4Q9PNG4_9APHY|nr:hypothetical protein BD310DRAFT_933130 [Dichomitus squalens]
MTCGTHHNLFNRLAWHSWWTRGYLGYSERFRLLELVSAMLERCKLIKLERRMGCGLYVSYLCVAKRAQQVVRQLAKVINTATDSEALATTALFCSALTAAQLHRRA